MLLSSYFPIKLPQQVNESSPVAGCRVRHSSVKLPTQGCTVQASKASPEHPSASAAGRHLKAFLRVTYCKQFLQIHYHTHALSSFHFRADGLELRKCEMERSLLDLSIRRPWGAASRAENQGKPGAHYLVTRAGGNRRHKEWGRGNGSCNFRNRYRFKN